MIESCLSERKKTEVFVLFFSAIAELVGIQHKGGRKEHEFFVLCFFCNSRTCRISSQRRIEEKKEDNDLVLYLFFALVFT